MTLTHFLIYSLATWRVTSLLVQEAGPFDIFMRIRKRVGIVHDEDGNVQMVPDTFFGSVFSCVWCCSIWIALGWVSFWLLEPDIAIILASLFGISTGAILMDKLIG